MIVLAIPYSMERSKPKTPATIPFSKLGAYVTVVLRNKKGDIIYGDGQPIDSIFDRKTHSFSIPIDDCPDYASYEIHASI